MNIIKHLDPNVGGALGGLETDGEEGSHAGGGVVAGAVGEDGELADDGGIIRVEDNRAVVGEDEEVAVGGEEDERVEVVLEHVGGLPEEGEVYVLGVGFALSGQVYDLKPF